MRYFLLLFVGFSLSPFSGFSQGHDSLFLATSLTKLENSKKYMMEIAETMPAEQYGFRPAEGSMEFGKQLLHVASNLGWLSSTYLSDGTNPVSAADKSLSDKDSIRHVLVRTYDHAISVLQDFSPDQLGDSVDFFAGPMTKMQIITLMSDHQTHHRGQMVVYLRMCGLTPPRYVGW